MIEGHSGLCVSVFIDTVNFVNWAQKLILTGLVLFSLCLNAVCWLLGGEGGGNEEVFFRSLLCSVADAALFMQRLKVNSVGLTQ